MAEIVAIVITCMIECDRSSDADIVAQRMKLLTMVSGIKACREQNLESELSRGEACANCHVNHESI